MPAAPFVAESSRHARAIPGPCVDLDLSPNVELVSPYRAFILNQAFFQSICSPPGFDLPHVGCYRLKSFSTFAFTAASILISGGQPRKLSGFAIPFFVASMLICILFWTCSRIEHHLSRLSFPPHVAKLDHPQRRRERNRQNAAEQTAHQGDDDRQRVQADAVEQATMAAVILNPPSSILVIMPAPASLIFPSRRGRHSSPYRVICPSPVRANLR